MSDEEKALQVTSALIKTDFMSNIRIVILQRGWVYIGHWRREKNNCQLSNAYCIRSWGTTKGLSELVHGATSKTILDKCDGIVEFDWLTVIHTICCDPSKWPNIK